MVPVAMGTRGRRLIALLLCVGMMACGGEDARPSDVVESDDGRSFAATLLMLVVVKDESSTSERYFDPNHVHRLELGVDGRAWGTFTVTPEDETPQNFRYQDDPTEKLVVTTLSEREDIEKLNLSTAEEWVEFLAQHLSPGGHVAQLHTLWLRAGEEEIEVPVERMIPFELPDGHESAMLGTIELDASAEEP